MEFPNLLELPEDQVQLVLQGYVAGMEDQKNSIIDLIEGVSANAEDFVVVSVLSDILSVLREETTIGDLLGE